MSIPHFSYNGIKRFDKYYTKILHFKCQRSKEVFAGGYLLNLSAGFYNFMNDFLVI